MVSAHSAAFVEPSAETIFGMSDAMLSVVAPIACYWIMSGFYETAAYLQWFPECQVYPPGEEQRRNLVSRYRVLRNVLSIQIVQVAFSGFLVVYFSASETVRFSSDFGTTEYFGQSMRSFTQGFLGASLESVAAVALRWTYLSARQLLAFFIFDTWAYWFHYVEHTIPWLYRNIHSIHHQNYVPYSFAASYNHPIEGFFNDSLGAIIAGYAVAISERELAVFFSIASVKAVDDHSAVLVPYNPVRLWGYIFGNGLYHHNVHHQVWGLKKNFGLYFLFWDRWNNTLYTGNRELGQATKQPVKHDAKED